MFHLACTRFNNSTYSENMSYREKNNEVVIYGATLQIRKIYSAGALIFVAEMNNDTNKIEGIGFIKNVLSDCAYFFKVPSRVDVGGMIIQSIFENR